VEEEVPVELPTPGLVPVEPVVVPLPCVVVEEPVEPEVLPVGVLWTIMAV
jgi:hypothetical protein